jgi:SNF family Na+-dependent transporter
MSLITAPHTAHTPGGQAFFVNYLQLFFCTSWPRMG